MAHVDLHKREQRNQVIVALGSLICLIGGIVMAVRVIKLYSSAGDHMNPLTIFWLLASLVFCVCLASVPYFLRTQILPAVFSIDTDQQRCGYRWNRIWLSSDSIRDVSSFEAKVIELPQNGFLVRIEDDSHRVVFSPDKRYRSEEEALEAGYHYSSRMNAAIGDKRVT